MASEHHHDHHHEDDHIDTSVLLRYMVNHNASHLDELKDLLDTLEKDSETYKLISAAVKDFAKGNKSLEKALKSIEDK